MRTDQVSDLILDVTARVITPRFRALDPDEVIQKKPGDLVTVADREAEAELTAAFLAATPGALIVGEEATFADASALGRLGDAEHAWVIDPVDGTRNFAAGKEDFGVMVAEVRRGETTRAWIWQPRHDALFVVEKGEGARVNGEPLPALAPRATPWTAAVWPRLRREDDDRLRLRSTRGACAVDYPALARGDIDALAYRSINPWDHLPGALLVTELGGVARVDGEPYRPGSTGRVLVVAASEDAERAVRAVALG
ncbi:inositol monophosphatase [Propioniciclava coleopterorum]|uniref:Inositol monophosphatase n=1 Tax=Propioniciclava coleopterorum TaxID=2714937 RepID=A0A6G7Y2E0_9ACTN|nr:inositol monophosphatase [Propioniciclava coleopterorum]QIK71044.1 inositol monophosphatase [Propioniciclava coleopterorum]